MVKKEEDILNVSHSLISKIYIIQQEAHGSHRSPEKPVLIYKQFAQSYDYTNLPFWFREKNKNIYFLRLLIVESPLPKGCFVLSFVDIGPVVLVKKIFKFVN